MDPITKIGVGLLILLFLPAVVAEGQGRRLAWGFHVALAAGGIAFAWATGGPIHALYAFIASLVCLALLAAAVAGAANLWRARLLTGGHIQLIAAGAAWLGPKGTFAMLVLAAATLIVTVAIFRIRNAATRPAMALITALCVVVTFVGLGLNNVVPL